MSGSKTRFGFSGANEPLPPHSPAPNPPQVSRTIIGRETHRPGAGPQKKIEVQATRPSEPKSGVPESVIREDKTERVFDRGRRPTGKSKFPPIARLLGRWTTGGGFLSRSRMLASDETLPAIPRNVWPSRIAIFLGAAVLSFLIALAVIKIGHLE
jgi:hypothetical protein